ncbi:outer membrane beta-barrel protein [Sphingosinicella sp. LHD-64]|uniref:outer membrane protein n=1 Tax=Sphingosinicella sp. LHD-64 TaxID=3072139 RepID=UPI00280EFC2A|nr:outer membrane beta-barrel protein [Sphingosinicella sp. LHD-64]MDQ8755255.1 outer membrane beta-barrel protein [Sphingosinicella sp. LHD-64]
MKIRYLAALLAATAAVPAFAQDGNFSGVRGEVRVGWDSAGVDATFPDPDDADETLSVDNDDDAIAYGAEIGYDLQLGDNFVIGAYGGLDFSQAELCGEVLGDDLGCVETGRNLTAGLRAGFVLGESVLVYAKGGYSNGRLRFDYDGDVEDDDNDLVAFNRNRGGYHLGGGFEVALNPNLYVKAEYVYTDYGSFDYAFGDEDDPLTARIGANRHQALAGIGFRF